MTILPFKPILRLPDSNIQGNGTANPQILKSQSLKILNNPASEW